MSARQRRAVCVLFGRLGTTLSPGRMPAFCVILLACRGLTAQRTDVAENVDAAYKQSPRGPGSPAAGPPQSFLPRFAKPLGPSDQTARTRWFSTVTSSFALDRVLNLGGRRAPPVRELESPRLPLPGDLAACVCEVQGLWRAKLVEPGSRSYSWPLGSSRYTYEAAYH